MPEPLVSILIGTAGLSVAALVALALAIARGIPSVDSAKRWSLLAVAVHAGHFAEEAQTGFYVRFPELLGLTPWPLSFFVVFNLLWIGVWVACIRVLGRWPRAAGFPIWFLALASAANGIVHPLLAWLAGGYFPGLWTSPAAGLAGIALLRALTTRASPVPRIE